MFPRKDILNWSSAGSLLCLLFVFNIVILTLVTFCHKPSLGREWLMAFRIIFWSLQDIIFDCIMMTIISQLLQTVKDHSGNHILFLWVFYSACSLSNVVMQATLLAWPLKLDQITSYLQEVFRLCNLWIWGHWKNRKWPVPENRKLYSCGAIRKLFQDVYSFG